MPVARFSSFSPRVLLAEDNADTADERLRKLLRAEFDVIASVEYGGALVDAAERLSRLESRDGLLPAAPALLKFLQHLVEREAADFLARRVFLERGEELPDDLLRRHELRVRDSASVLQTVDCRQPLYGGNTTTSANGQVSLRKLA